MRPFPTLLAACLLLCQCGAFASPESFHALVATLADKPETRFIVGYRGQQTFEKDLIQRVSAACTAVHRPATLWIAVPALTPFQDANQRALAATPGCRQPLDEARADELYDIAALVGLATDEKTYRGIKHDYTIGQNARDEYPLEDLIALGHLRVEVMNPLNLTRLDINRFLATPGPSVAAISLSRAIARRNAQQEFELPWDGRTVMLDPDQEYVVRNLDHYNERRIAMTGNVYARAQSGAPTVLLAHHAAWEQVAQVGMATVREWFQLRGNVVAELPVLEHDPHASWYTYFSAGSKATTLPWSRQRASCPGSWTSGVPGPKHECACIAPT